jgi:hypothetical protein
MQLPLLIRANHLCNRTRNTATAQKNRKQSATGILSAYVGSCRDKSRQDPTFESQVQIVPHTVYAGKIDVKRSMSYRPQICSVAGPGLLQIDQNPSLSKNHSARQCISVRAPARTGVQSTQEPQKRVRRYPPHRCRCAPKDYELFCLGGLERVGN